MRDRTAELAQSITWTGSKQTYYTGRLMVDKDLVSDFNRAYAYFRWSDDMIDASSLSSDERIAFIKRQRDLIYRLYNHNRPDELTAEEEILADLICHDRGENSGLQSFIRNMFAIIEFDTYRKDRIINESELTWYTNSLAKSVTDGLQYFVGNGHPYPASDSRYSAALAAHITHLLRDMVHDTRDGFINIPREYLETHNIGPDNIQNPLYQAWVRARVELAREHFHQGKRYLGELDVLRTKIVGFWYCARFESVLNTIERDGYKLRDVYEERRKISTWLKIVWLGVSVTLRHFARRIFLDS
jgi:phytoene/squalene synthetase